MDRNQTMRSSNKTETIEDIPKLFNPTKDFNSFSLPEPFSFNSPEIKLNEKHLIQTSPQGLTGPTGLNSPPGYSAPTSFFGFLNQSTSYPLDQISKPHRKHKYCSECGNKRDNLEHKYCYECGFKYEF
jgi:hypothetical protein